MSDIAKYCLTCGKQIGEGVTVCSQCGTAVEAPVAAPAATTTTTTTTTTAPENPKKGNGMALAGFIVSLVSLILCCGSLSLISLILSIIGVVAAKKVDGKGKGLSIAGIIISALGIILLIVAFFIAPMLGYSSYFDKVNNEWQDLSEYNTSDYDFDYGN